MIYAANLKCNHTRASFESYAKALNSSIEDQTVLVFPPSQAFFSGGTRFVQGAQNFYPCQNGSYTGEIGADMLDEFEIKTVLIGHSERRMLGEDEPFLRAKFDFAKEKGWDIIYCVGEDDITHMNGSTKEFLSDQLENIDLEYENLVIAYEPIWAIGSGKSATNEMIEDILSFIATKTSAPLLYGGSVNLSNVTQIKNIKNCDGVLVGTASWIVENFINMIKSK